MSAWLPKVGAVVNRAGGTTFRVWAPVVRRVDIAIDRGGAIDERELTREADGTFVATLADVGPGVRYGYRLDGDGPFPDPASRFQPDGVHGASLTVDPDAFHWTDDGWTGVPLSDLIIYELHVGTFTRDGTFAAVIDRLPELAALGVTAVELMPVGDFPGARNWGYDGVAIFAPARCYGSPDDLRWLVDAAHHQGMAVLLDVVYNHLGPDGASHPRFSPYYFSPRHHSPWGAGLNFDDDHSAPVRELFIENALHWIQEYHVDGLRLDATHAIRDLAPRHFLAELTARVRESAPARHVHVIAEDDRNLARLVIPQSEGGFGADAVWADDWHHQMRRRLAGDCDGYFGDYTGSTADIAATVRRGWFYTGQYSNYLKAPRGSDPSGIEPARFVVCLQNHDQVGNRAFGERLHHQIDAAAYRAASLLLLSLPQTPLLFMGQEWGATSPFLFFADHAAELGRKVTAGRRREFARFAAFADEGARERIPDPQAPGTFAASQLDWTERERPQHASISRLYAAALAFRRERMSPGTARDAATARALDHETLRFDRLGNKGEHLAVVTRFGDGLVRLQRPHGAGHCSIVLSSEDCAFGGGPRQPEIDNTGPDALVRFSGAATIIVQFTAPVEVPAG